MNKYTQKVANHVSKLELSLEEKVLAATKIMVEDKIRVAVYTGASFVAGGGTLPAEAFRSVGRGGEASDEGGDSMIELNGAPQMILALTNKRLIFFRMSGFFGRPKEALGEIPVDRVERIETEKGVLMGFACGILKFFVNNAEPFQFMVPKVHISKAKSLKSEFDRLKSG